MLDRVLVSVVTATYNMGEYVGLAVQSVLDQTYPHVASIVVDDGSSDNTAKVMERYKRDPRVTYIRLESNQGQAVAKNRGIKVAKGEFLAFVDADNIWKPHKLEKQLPLFRLSPNIGVVYSDAELIDGNGHVLPSSPRKYYQGKITAPLLAHNFVNFNSAVVKRQCLEKIGIFNEALAMGIDWDLWLRISTQYEFAFLDQATYCYRIWPNQMSHNKLKRLGCAQKILAQFFDKHPDAVTAADSKKAWAALFADYASVHAGYGHFTQALRYYLRSLVQLPTEKRAWKGLLKSFLRKV